MGIEQIFDQVISYLDWICGSMAFIILLGVAYAIYKVYQRFARRPPRRAETAWETKIWEILRDMCELMDMDKEFIIKSDKYSPIFPVTYTCMGILNFYGWVSVILLREKGAFPTSEVVLTRPYLIEGIGSETITLKANGLTPYGIFMKPILRYNERDSADDLDVEVGEFYNLMVMDKLTPVLQAKGAEQTIAVLERDGQVENLISKALKKGEQLMLGGENDN